MLYLYHLFNFSKGIKYMLNSYLVKNANGFMLSCKNECSLALKKLFVTMHMFTNNDITVRIELLKVRHDVTKLYLTIPFTY